MIRTLGELLDAIGELEDKEVADESIEIEFCADPNFVSWQSAGRMIDKVSYVQVVNGKLQIALTG
jgi:transcription antitermination factor NusA-like protein